MDAISKIILHFGIYIEMAISKLVEPDVFEFTSIFVKSQWLDISRWQENLCYKNLRYKVYLYSNFFYKSVQVKVQIVYFISNYKPYSTIKIREHTKLIIAVP